MLKLKQAVIVEGKYDKAKLSALVDADIITTDGFDVFRDKAKLNLIRALAERDGVVILTDSDAAGFRIRGYIAGAVDPAKITHVYIPDIFGKERRKEKSSAEGKLGVEGMPADVLLEAFRRAGVSVAADDVPLEPDGAPPKRPVTPADFVEWGLSGGDNSFSLRQQALKKLGMPARMSVKAMLAVINRLYGYDAFLKLLETL